MPQQQDSDPGEIQSGEGEPGSGASGTPAQDAFVPFVEYFDMSPQPVEYFDLGEAAA